MAKKGIEAEIDKVLRIMEANPDTPADTAANLLNQARISGDGPLRQKYLRKAQKIIAEIDPHEEPEKLQALQAQVLALQGRGGDTEIAHVTPGEIVIPARMRTPELMAALARAAQQAGIDPRRLVVGSRRNSHNPRTGQAEFADPGIPEIDDIYVSTHPMPAVDMEREREVGRRAAAIYGETSSLYPQKIDPKKSVLDPNNWNQDSAAQLQKARTDLGTMYGTINDAMKPRLPPVDTNRYEEQQWGEAVRAADASINNILDPRFTNMAMHQQGIGPQTIEKWTDKAILDSQGPFINTVKPTAEQLDKLQAIGNGPRAYIDFYGKKPK